MTHPLIARLDAPGPKRILACDGGGIRGMISVEILAKLEADLRAELDNPKLVLADWFDFVCGTSTGAIIAACIATGMTMDQIRSFYRKNGTQMFEEASLKNRLAFHNYNDEPLAELLRTELNLALGITDKKTLATLGNENIKTLLMMVLRNHSTDSPWPLSNNPRAKYNQPGRRDCNLRLPLWQLLRASTAAPVYFPAEKVTFAPGTSLEYTFVFVDGGITTYNNPAFLAFQMATAAPYKMNWATGVDNMLIVSVGTGNAPNVRPELKSKEIPKWDHAFTVPAALMNSASAGWDMVCRMLGECRHGAPIDREIGDMVLAPHAPTNWSGTKQFAYVRYDPDLTKEELRLLGLTNIDPELIGALDAVAFIEELREVGKAYAAVHVDINHLKGFTKP